MWKMLKYLTCTRAPVSSPLVASAPLCWAQNQVPSESPCPNVIIPRFFPGNVKVPCHCVRWQSIPDRYPADQWFSKTDEENSRAKEKKEKIRLHKRDIRSALALSTHNFILINCPARDKGTRCHLRLQSINYS